MRTNDVYKRKEELGMSHQTITDRLKKLEKGGWLINEKSIKEGRLSSTWKLSPEAVQALGSAFNYTQSNPLKILEEKLSDPSIKTHAKMKLIQSSFRDFQLVLGACALASIRHAITYKSYPGALETWKRDFTLLVEQQSLGLLRLLHKHRKLVLEALPSATQQMKKAGLSIPRGS